MKRAFLSVQGVPTCASAGTCHPVALGVRRRQNCPGARARAAGLSGGCVSPRPPPEPGDSRRPPATLHSRPRGVWTLAGLCHGLRAGNRPAGPRPVSSQQLPAAGGQRTPELGGPGLLLACPFHTHGVPPGARGRPCGRAQCCRPSDCRGAGAAWLGTSSLPGLGHPHRLLKTVVLLPKAHLEISGEISAGGRAWVGYHRWPGMVAARGAGEHPAVHRWAPRQDRAAPRSAVPHFKQAGFPGGRSLLTGTQKGPGPVQV